MSLHSSLAAYPDLATQVTINRFKHTDSAYALVACITLVDGSLLYLRDYLFPDGSRKYAYHWQTASGDLIGRWDNEPHWRQVATYPHHYHPPFGSVEPSNVRRIEDVISMIAVRLGVAPLGD